MLEEIILCDAAGYTLQEAYTLYMSYGYANRCHPEIVAILNNIIANDIHKLNNHHLVGSTHSLTHLTHSLTHSYSLTLTYLVTYLLTYLLTCYLTHSSGTTIMGISKVEYKTRLFASAY